MKGDEPSGASAIEAIRAKLDKYPQLRYEETATAIKVLPESEDGFSVSLQQIDREFMVEFAGWHEEFETESEALDCFAFGLSEGCRLKVVSHGRFDCRWTVQGIEDGEWRDGSQTGLLLFPFWLRRRERFLQNHVITDE